MGPKQSLESFAAGKLGLAFLQEVVHQDDEQGPDFQPPMEGEISHFDTNQSGCYHPWHDKVEHLQPLIVEDLLFQLSLGWLGETRDSVSHGIELSTPHCNPHKL